MPLEIKAQKSKIVLAAIKEKKSVKFKNKTRILNTVFTSKSDLDFIYPGTKKTCEYILRNYFHIEIHLNMSSNNLVSMDGTSFDLKSLDTLDKKSNVIFITNQTIKLIGDMYFGYSELESFIEKYPKAKIYHYAPYEIVALERLTSLHKVNSVDYDHYLNLGKFVDLFKIVKQAVYVSQKSYSLKDIEKYYDTNFSFNVAGPIISKHNKSSILAVASVRSFPSTAFMFAPVESCK